MNDFTSLMGEEIKIWVTSNMDHSSIDRVTHAMDGTKYVCLTGQSFVRKSALNSWSCIPIIFFLELFSRTPPTCSRWWSSSSSCPRRDCWATRGRRRCRTTKSWRTGRRFCSRHSNNYTGIGSGRSSTIFTYGKSAKTNQVQVWTDYGIMVRFSSVMLHRWCYIDVERGEYKMAMEMGLPQLLMGPSIVVMLLRFTLEMYYFMMEQHNYF